MKLHQIFIDVGKGHTFRDVPMYSDFYDNNKKYYSIKVWSEEDLDALMLNYPEFIDMYNSFPHKWYKMDFCKTFIIHSEGGFYMDMDNEILDFFDFDCDYLVSNWLNEVASDLIYFRNRDEYIEYARFMKDRYYKCKMPTTWVTRRLQYSVAQKCFNQYCKLNRISAITDLPFKRYCTQMWLKVFNKKKIQIIKH